MMTEGDESAFVSISEMQPSIDDHDDILVDEGDVMADGMIDSGMDCGLDDDTAAAVGSIIAKDNSIDDDDTAAAVSSTKVRAKEVVINRTSEEEMIRAARNADDSNSNIKEDILDEFFEAVTEYVCQEQELQQLKEQHQQKLHQQQVLDTHKKSNHDRTHEMKCLSPAASQGSHSRKKDAIDLVFENLENATCNSNHSHVTMTSNAFKRAQDAATAAAGKETATTTAPTESFRETRVLIHQALEKMRDSACAATIHNSKERVHTWMAEFESTTCLQEDDATSAQVEDHLEENPAAIDLMDRFFQRVEDKLCSHVEMVFPLDHPVGDMSKENPTSEHGRDKDALDVVFEKIENTLCEPNATTSMMLQEPRRGGEDVANTPRSEASSTSNMSRSTFRSPTSWSAATSRSEHSRSTFSFSDHSRASMYAEETTMTETSSATANTTTTRSENVALLSASSSHDDIEDDDDDSDFGAVNRPLFVITEEVSATESTSSDLKQSQSNPHGRGDGDAGYYRHKQVRDGRRVRGRHQATPLRHYHQWNANCGSQPNQSRDGAKGWLRRLRVALELTVSRLTAVLEQSTMDVAALCGSVNTTSEYISGVSAILCSTVDTTSDTNEAAAERMGATTESSHSVHGYRSTPHHGHRTSSDSVSRSVSPVPSDEFRQPEDPSARQQHEDSLREEHPITRTRRQQPQDPLGAKRGTDHDVVKPRVDPEPGSKDISYGELVQKEAYDDPYGTPSDQLPYCARNADPKKTNGHTLSSYITTRDAPDNVVTPVHSENDGNVSEEPLIKSPKSSESNKTGATEKTADETMASSADAEEIDGPHGVLNPNTTYMRNDSTSAPAMGLITCRADLNSVGSMNSWDTTMAFMVESRTPSHHERSSITGTTSHHSRRSTVAVYSRQRGELHYQRQQQMPQHEHHRADKSQEPILNVAADDNNASTGGTRSPVVSSALLSPEQQKIRTMSSPGAVSSSATPLKAGSGPCLRSTPLANDLDGEEEANEEEFGIFDDTEEFSFDVGLQDTTSQDDFEDEMALRRTCTDLVVYEQKPFLLSRYTTPWQLVLYMAWMSISFLIKTNGNFSSQLARRKEALQSKLRAVQHVAETAAAELTMTTNGGYSLDSLETLPSIDRQDSYRTADATMKTEIVEC